MADHLEQRADIFVPGGGDRRSALCSVTHLAIGAHPDDCGFMAFPGTEECRRGGGKSGAVVLTDGVGGGCDLRIDWGNGEKFAFALGWKILPCASLTVCAPRWLIACRAWAHV